MQRPTPLNMPQSPTPYKWPAGHLYHLVTPPRRPELAAAAFTISTSCARSGATIGSGVEKRGQWWVGMKTDVRIAGKFFEGVFFTTSENFNCPQTAAKFTKRNDCLIVCELSSLLYPGKRTRQMPQCLGGPQGLPRQKFLGEFRRGAVGAPWCSWRAPRDSGARSATDFQLPPCTHQGPAPPTAWGPQEKTDRIAIGYLRHTPYITKAQSIYTVQGCTDSNEGFAGLSLRNLVTLFGLPFASQSWQAALRRVRERPAQKQAPC